MLASNIHQNIHTKSISLFCDSSQSNISKTKKSKQIIEKLILAAQTKQAILAQ